MKRLPFLLSLFVLALGLFSCQEDNSFTADNSLTEIPADDLSTRTVEFPGKIPADAYVNTLMMSGTATWRDYDAYYRGEMRSYADEHYFQNLQWATLAQVVQHPQFLAEAEASTKDFYLEEMMAREYINKPEVAALLLNDLLTRSTEAEVADLARKVLEKNKQHYNTSEERYQGYLDRNGAGLRDLFVLGYDRWANPK